MSQIDNTNLGHLIENMYESFLNKENVIEGQIVDLADVAFSGSYNDLIDKPSELEVTILYDDLKLLRDTGKLIPGSKYRITDYVATTTDTQSRSANHPFDIIVTALTEETLSEECEATLHEGDVYFENAEFSAWKVWYTIDNDKNRFNWADPTNGKGVVYRLIDERNNDVPYDFKGIQFKRYRVTAKAAYNDTLGQLNDLPIGLQGSYSKGFNIDTSNPKWYYTFSKLGSTWNEEVTDATLDKSITAHRTKIGISYASGYHISALNNIVFANGQVLTDFCLAITPDVESGWINTKLVADTCILTTASNNLSMFGDTCHCFAETAFRRNTFFGLNAQRHSTIGSDVQDNTVVAIYDSSFNRIGSYFSGNILFTPWSLVSNNIGSNFRDNTITNLTNASVLYYNDFAPGFQNNTIEGYIRETHTGSRFTNNTGTGLQMDYCTFNGNFHDNILNNRIADLDCSGQITYCEFNGNLTNCTFDGIFTYVIIPAGANIFAHIDVRGGIRGTEQVPATLDASQFRLAAVTGNTRRIAIESDVDKSIVATWLENGERVGIYKYVGDAEWKPWMNRQTIYYGSEATAEQKAHNLTIVQAWYEKGGSSNLLNVISEDMYLVGTSGANMVGNGLPLHIYQIFQQGGTYTVFGILHWVLFDTYHQDISFQIASDGTVSYAPSFDEGEAFFTYRSIHFDLGAEGVETTIDNPSSNIELYSNSLVDAYGPRYRLEDIYGPNSIGYGYELHDSYYDVFFDTGDKTIRMRAYSDHVTILWRYKVDAADLVILDGGHAPSP